MNRDYAIASAFRFMDDWPTENVQRFVDAARAGQNGLLVEAPQKVLF